MGLVLEPKITFTVVPAIIISNYSSYSYFSANYLSIYFSQIGVVIRSNLFCDEIVIIPYHIYAICAMKFVVAHTVETHSCASLQRQPIDFFISGIDMFSLYPIILIEHTILYYGREI